MEFVDKIQQDVHVRRVLPPRLLSFRSFFIVPESRGEGGVCRVIDSIEQLWQETLRYIEGKLSKPSYDTWISQTEALAIHEDTLVVVAPNEFVRDWLEDRYLSFIQEAVQDVTGIKFNIQFVLPEEEEETRFESKAKTGPPKPPTAEEKEEKNESHSNVLNDKYTFDTFVIGAGNRFAHAASLAVAEAPAKAYNPLFIYGGVGLGKTHLMHAIGHYVLDHIRNARVAYVTSEKFTNEFINAIQYNKAEEFRNRYRNTDILLIDDIQFLAGKEQTQEEFFHTFNALHEASKQIVISSDRPPKEIPTLEDRLRSRFEWGLITDIQPPDLETRIAILRKKAKAEGFDIENEVMVYIANQIDSNIRELEGALIRVVAYSSLTNQDITVDLAADALKDIVSTRRPKAISISHIQKTVSDHFNLRVEDLKSKRRTKSVAFPRQIAMYLARKLTDASLPKIGDAFGGRDHTTVIHAFEKISTQLKHDAELNDVIKNLQERVKNGD